MNFFTAPAGTAGSVGSTLAYFSKATPLASASVGALAGAAAAGVAAEACLTTVVVSPEPPDDANAKTETTMARTAARAARPMPTIIHSWRTLPSLAGAAAGLGRPSAA